MKMLHFTKLAIFLFLLNFIYAAEIPVLVEVQKDTPLFSRPSIKSERLAEAEAGTLLIFVNKSKKGIWLQLKDSEGMSGWMPADRTDYKDIANAREQVKILEENTYQQKENLDKKTKSKEELMEEIMRSRAQKESLPFLRIAPFLKWVNKEEPTTSRIGLKVDYNLGQTGLAHKNVLNPAWAVFEASFPSPFVNSNSDMSFALRYSWKAPLWGPFVYVPDIGYSLDKLEDAYRHHLSLGLAGGIEIGPLDIRIRGGYDAFAHSRSSVDVQLGVNF